MGVKVELEVPSVNPLEYAPIVGRIVQKWGGVKIVEVAGLWMGPDGKVVPDHNAVLTCSVGEFDDDVYTWWHDMAEIVRKVFAQECVILSFTPQDAELVYEGHTERIGGNDANISDAS